MHFLEILQLIYIHEDASKALIQLCSASRVGSVATSALLAFAWPYIMIKAVQETGFRKYHSAERIRCNAHSAYGNPIPPLGVQSRQATQSRVCSLWTKLTP